MNREGFSICGVISAEVLQGLRIDPEFERTRDLFNNLIAVQQTPERSGCITIGYGQPLTAAADLHALHKIMIRELKASELPALLELYGHLHAADDPRPTQGRIEQIWEAIRQNPHLKYFGVFVDGALVSSCTLSIIPNLTRGCRPYGIIENVVTHADFRRKRHGRSVLRHALDQAWSFGCYKVMVLTGRKDEGTYEFYESAGFARNAKQAFLAKPPKG